MYNLLQGIFKRNTSTGFIRRQNRKLVDRNNPALAKAPGTVENIYRRPKDSNFYNNLREVLEKVCNKRTNIVAVGDLNSDSLNDTEPQQKSTGKKLSRILNSFSLKNVIKTSTRITRTSESLIDIMITKSKEKVIETDVVHCGISDHSLVYGIYKIKKKEKELLRIKIVKEFS